MHERRPGTTVCLHCRHAARAVSRDRRKRLILRASAFAIVATTLGAVGVLGASAIRGYGATRHVEPRVEHSVAQSSAKARDMPAVVTTAASEVAQPQTPTPTPVVQQADTVTRAS